MAVACGCCGDWREAARCEALVLEVRGTAVRVGALAFLEWFKKAAMQAYRWRDAQSLAKRGRDKQVS